VSRTLMIPDVLYAWLESTARACGFSGIAQLLEVWQSREDALRHCQQAVAQIDALRERLFSTYGAFPDSTEYVREDRAR
jgi:hypothetical protein